MKPTPKQLRYLRTLAERTGQTFTYPQTAAQASAEIKRLKGEMPTPPADRHREQRAVQRDMATGRGDAAQVRPDETTGYGAKLSVVASGARRVVRWERLSQCRRR